MMPCSFLQRPEQVFKPVELYLMDFPEHIAQFAFRETFLGKPEHIMFRQVNKAGARVFAERHLCLSQFQEVAGIRVRAGAGLHLLNSFRAKFSETCSALLKSSGRNLFILASPIRHPPEYALKNAAPALSKFSESM